MKYKALFLSMVFCLPIFSHAAVISKPFEVSGWIPYWRTASGTGEAVQHLDAFTEVNPFVYTVKSDGTLYDNGNMASSSWKTLQADAKLRGIRFIPTTMSGSGENIDAVLRSPTLRKAHINSIVSTVYANNFDGIDIDYEAKLPSTAPYFSIFLRDLYKAMGNKWVQCTIEARTPPDSASNDRGGIPVSTDDYSVLNKYCDRIRIMTYDQRVVDKKLSSNATGPYMPVADPIWVEKVISYALQYFPKKKVTLGIATYGYEYEVTQLSSGYNYKYLWAFNPKYAINLAAEQGLTPQRNSAGELSLTYRSNNSTTQPQPANALLALTDQSFHLLWWSDAQAIKDKVDLAKRLGIRGVSIFKIDGGADPGMWNVLQ